MSSALLQRDPPRVNGGEKQLSILFAKGMQNQSEVLSIKLRGEIVDEQYRAQAALRPEGDLGNEQSEHQQLLLAAR